MKKSIKKRIVIVMGCMLVFGLCACGESQSQSRSDNTESLEGASAITLKKDGSVALRLVEDFGEDNSEDELKNLIDTSITEYKSQADQAQVTLKSCKKNAENQLIVEMTFNDSSAYAGWNNYFYDYIYLDYMRSLGMDADNSIENSTEGFFAGTISDAYTAGYGLETTLQAASDNSEKQSVSKSDLLSMGDNHIVIVERYQEDAPVTVNCYDEILYVGDGVTAAGKKSANISTTDGYGIIVFK